MPKLSDINQLRDIEWSKKHLWDIFFENVTGGNSNGVSVKKITETLTDRIENQFLGTPGSIPSDGDLFQWYPITRVTDEVINISNFDVPGTYYNHPIPKGGKVLSISVTFVDDVANSMFNWCKTWMDPFTTVDLMSSNVNIKMKSTSSITTGTNIATAAGIKDITKITEETRCIKTVGEMIKVIGVTKLDNQMNDVVTSRYVVIPDGTLTYVGDSDDGLHTYELKMLKVKTLPDSTGLIPPRFDLITKKTAGVLRRLT